MEVSGRGCCFFFWFSGTVGKQIFTGRRILYNFDGRKFEKLTQSSMQNNLIVSLYAHRFHGTVLSRYMNHKRISLVAFKCTSLGFEVINRLRAIMKNLNPLTL